MNHAAQRMADNWAVHRQDDNGNCFVVRAGLGQEEAVRLAAELESRGHKQFYWVAQEPEVPGEIGGPSVEA